MSWSIDLPMSASFLKEAYRAPDDREPQTVTVRPLMTNGAQLRWISLPGAGMPL